MGRQVLTRANVVTAPYDVELGALDTLTPDAIFAHFDGSGAGGSFLPCVTYYTQDGKVFARAFPASSVAAGASADVSYFPGLSQSPATVGGTGIQFDTVNNGGYLIVNATSVAGMQLNLYGTGANAGADLEVANHAASAGGGDNADLLISTDDGSITIQQTSHATATDAMTIGSDGGINIQAVRTLNLGGVAAGAGAAINVGVATDTPIRISSSAAGKIGFYGKAPVSRPAAPVTLADVIAALQTLGLTA